LRQILDGLYRRPLCARRFNGADAALIRFPDIVAEL